MPGASLRVRRNGLFYRACVAPALLVILVAALAPLAILAVSSLADQETGALTLRYYVASLTSRLFMVTLATTIAMALGVTILSVLLAMPVAYTLARRTLLRKLLIPVISVPRMLPLVVIGYAMVLLLAPHTGALNRFLQDIGLLSAPSFILFDWPGQALAFLYSGIVVAIAVLTGVFMSVDPQMEDAAMSLGAGRLRAILTVTMPLGIPGVIAASALIFSTVVTAYSIPVMLNSRTPYMVSVLIYGNLFSLQETHLAYTQAIIVSILAIAVTASSHIFLSRYGNRR